MFGGCPCCSAVIRYGVQRMSAMVCSAASASGFGCVLSGLSLSCSFSSQRLSASMSLRMCVQSLPLPCHSVLPFPYILRYVLSGLPLPCGLGRVLSGYVTAAYRLLKMRAQRLTGRVPSGLPLPCGLGCVLSGVPLACHSGLPLPCGWGRGDWGLALEMRAQRLTATMSQRASGA